MRRILVSGLVVLLLAPAASAGGEVLEKAAAKQKGKIAKVWMDLARYLQTRDLKSEAVALGEVDPGWVDGVRVAIERDDERRPARPSTHPGELGVPALGAQRLRGQARLRHDEAVLGLEARRGEREGRLRVGAARIRDVGVRARRVHRRVGSRGRVVTRGQRAQQEQDQTASSLHAATIDVLCPKQSGPPPPASQIRPSLCTIVSV